MITGLDPAAATVQEEIFGPVLVSLTFRTPAEAIALANNTRYGLAASVWSDNINLALDVASKIKAGSVWVNCTNLFDGASGFGGYRECGFGREGGQEGLFEYLRPKWMPRPRPDFTPPAEGESSEVGRARPGPAAHARVCIVHRQGRRPPNARTDMLCRTWTARRRCISAASRCARMGSTRWPC